MPPAEEGGAEASGEIRWEETPALTSVPPHP